MHRIQAFGRLTDLRRTGQKNEHAALIFRYGLHNRSRNRCCQRLLGFAVAVVGFHREGLTRAGQDRRLAQQPRHRSGFDGSGHDDQPQGFIIPLLDVPAQCQAQIRCEAAFVKLVENDEPRSG